jgi:hypothetical protein
MDERMEGTSMISPLENQPLSKVMEMLEVIATENDLLLSTNLIDFADDIYKIAYEAGVEYEIQRAYHAEMMTPIEQEESLIRALNARTQRSNDERAIDKV